MPEGTVLEYLSIQLNCTVLDSFSRLDCTALVLELAGT
jgi:hypothetical protein